MALEGFDRRGSAGVVSVGDAALKEAQRVQAFLQQAHPRSGRSALQLALIAQIGGGRRRGGGRGNRRRGWRRHGRGRGDGNRAGIQQLLGLYVGDARRGQAVVFLKRRHRRARVFQIGAADLIAVIAVDRQRFLQLPHVGAAHFVLQFPVAIAVYDLLKRGVGRPGFLQAISRLYPPHGFARQIAELAAQRSVIIQPFLQARLQRKHSLALVAVFQGFIGLLFGQGENDQQAQDRNNRQQTLHRRYLEFVSVIT